MTSETDLERKKELLACLGAVRLEQAVTLMREDPVRLERSDFDSLLSPMAENLRRARQSALHAEADRWVRRMRAIRGFRDHGPDPLRMIAPVELTEGYNGKILLVSLSGGVVAQMVCLRSGDDRHREILANTREEIRDLGFTDCWVHELGGASVYFEQSGAISLWGTSNEYGACDKGTAAALITEAFPGRRIIAAD